MYAYIERTTNSGEVKHEMVKNIKRAIFFDDIGARIQVDDDCCVRKPVKIKDVDNYVEKL